MPLVVQIILYLCAAGIGGTIFLLFRLNWTFEARMRILDEPGKTTSEQLAQYERLPDYNTMMWRVWVWDVRKFLK